MRKTLAWKSVFFLFLISVCMDLPAGFAGPWNDGPGYRGQSLCSPRRVVYGMTADRSRGHHPTLGETFRRTIPESGEIVGGILPWNWNGYGMALGIGAVTLPLFFTKDEIQRTIGLDAPGDVVPPDAISFVESDEFYTHYEFLGDKTAIPALSGGFVLVGMLLEGR